ncbi:uncharacterized protein BO80DRAFT_86200 [Aspergillus ibericus CBS 121593]|uniref:Uncharacterized protein n=1 Tax=Aspergillus ibericus CBS 121593 TaxID=1448316 RepID=A0A395HDD1_9EURO|nr:hypothetical protein BO80DRAFT_86200 [Aspergillus ibericus CBS 121593]RAL05991.1 hypothetical protein BO80DRAFT_86200 [Aspergillus ibericus CBS 121593]
MVSSNQKTQPQKPRVMVDLHRQPHPQQYQPQQTRIPPRGGGRGSGGGRAPVHDIRQTTEYKAAARRWLSVMVALPILMYTSWSLYERTYGEKSPKRVIPHSSASASASSADSSAAGADGKKSE